MNTKRFFLIFVSIFLVSGIVFCVIAVTVALADLPAQGADPSVGPILVMVFGLVGGIFIATALGFGVAAGSGERKKRRLLATGERVTAQVVGVEQNFAFSAGGRAPWQLVCRYEEGGLVYLCRSEHIWYNPTNLLRGDHVTIYRDPRNYKKYYVDISDVLIQIVQL